MAFTRFAATIGFLSAALCAGSALSQSGAEPRRVDLELALLADASGSIDAAEIAFQRQGYVAALADPGLIKLMTSGYHGAVALTYVEWGSDTSQDVVVDWTVIDGPAAAAAFSAALTAAPRRAFGRNAIGAALIKATEMLRGNDLEGDRLVIDFSADSANNWYGPSIQEGRDAALAAGVTINGLAVLCRSAGCGGRPVAYDLEAAFAREIVGGPGAFVVTADDPASFASAVREKLYLEVSGQPAPTRTAAAPAQR